MKLIEPKFGINQRLHPHDVKENQFVSMQNFDMGHFDAHDEHFKLIKGSTKYHGASIGTNAATHIAVHYDNSRDIAHVLACVDGTIQRKVQGSNEFEILFSGLVPNKITSSCNVGSRTYFAHPIDGILEYDGYSVTKVNNSPKLSQIVFIKEVNRGFGIDALNPDSFVWTNDVTESGGVPISWDAINVDVVPSDEGDIEECLFILRGRLVHLRTNGIWIYYIGGSPSTWRPEKANVDVGIIAAKTAKLVNNEIWFLGNSPKKGRGLFAFDGKNVRMLSYDVEKIFYRMNPYRIKNACAEYISNLYKLSFSIDSDTENNSTLHFDTIYFNPETNLPNVYGIHTYGFETSAVLNTRQFGGEHIFARKYNNGSWVFKTDNVYTQYGNPMVNDGDLIAGKVTTPMYEQETIDGNTYGSDWYKRFEKLIVSFPISGAFNLKIDIFKDYGTNPAKTIYKSVKGNTLSIDELILGVQPLESVDQDTVIGMFSLIGRAIQFEFSNDQLNQPCMFSKFSYDSRIVRRSKNAQLIH